MSESDYYELMARIDPDEHSPIMVGLLEQAVRIADSLNDPELAFNTRKMLIFNSTMCGMPDKAMPAFSWCLSRVDKTPEKFEAKEMLWEYKWILASLRQFPAISLKQIESIEEDFKGRLMKAGYSLRPYYHALLERFSYPEQAERQAEYFDLWRKAKRDRLADCHACEESGVAEHYFLTDQPKKGLKKADQILAKNLSCLSVPHRLIAYMLVPLAKAQRLEDAKELHTRGYQMIRHNQAFITAISQHIEYLVYTSDVSSALRLVANHLAWALDTRKLLCKIDFMLQSGIALRKAGSKKRKLKLTNAFPQYRSDGTYIPVELADWFDSETDSLANLFDSRNQNLHLANWVAKTRAEYSALP